MLGTVYVCSAIFGYVQQIIMVNVAQKTATMRRDINHKLARLP